jgi:DNA-binding FadR family transcriptional regulator
LEKPLVDRTVDSIIEYIINENLGSGDKLPNEYNLAKNLDVGRSTLREAVRSLVSRNVLEVRQGSGTYVSNNIGISEDPLGFSFVKDTLKLTEDLFALRYILEPEVAMLAAHHRTEQQMSYLEKIAEEIEETITTTDHEHFELDIEFHSIIAKMSRNIALDHLIPVINQSITLYNSYYTNEQSKAETIPLHREIVQAIRDKNPIQAKYSMQLHIANNQRQLEINRQNNMREEE